ncbi:MAG: hypothetical protein HYY05_00660, partial [Chloroflexi bacterium]|nr:hypothetical protein [Chloroflexota bacterium]
MYHSLILPHLFGSRLSPAGSSRYASKAALWYLLAIPTILVGALLAEQIPLLQELDAFFSDDRPFWVGLTGGMAMAGALVLVGAQFVIRRPTAEELSEEALGEGVRATFSPMSHGEVEEMILRLRALAAWPFIWWRFLYRVVGGTAGRSFEVEAPMRAVKQAWRRGAWRHN